MRGHRSRRAALVAMCMWRDMAHEWCGGHTDASCATQVLQRSAMVARQHAQEVSDPNRSVVIDTPMRVSFEARSEGDDAGRQ